MSEKACGNCGAVVKNGSRCNNCYVYRRAYGVERPVELEQNRWKAARNYTGKCLNCHREITNYQHLCRACWMWRKRHNGEMRPVEKEQRLKNPTIEQPKEKEKICGKCRYLRINHKQPDECKSCRMKRTWREGKMTHRRASIRPDVWTENHIRKLQELAGTMPAKDIAERITEEFGIPRTAHAVEVMAHKHHISIMYCGDWTVQQTKAVLGLADDIVTRLLKFGIIRGYKVQETRSGHWYIAPENIERFIRTHPYLLDHTRIKNKRLRSIAEGEFVRNPWLTIENAARIMGVHRTIIDRLIKANGLETTPRIIAGAFKWHRVFIYRRPFYEFLKRREEQVS